VILRVPSPAEPPRLDRFIAANLHGVSRKRIKGLIDAGQVRVGDRTERRAGRRLAAGDVVEVDWRPSLLGPSPRLTRADVLASGPGWWAIAKPVGLPSHRTADDAPAAPERLAEVLGHDAALQPVHRLDRETSGVLLLAHGPTIGELSARFEHRRMAKTYLAVVRPAPVADAAELVDSDADMRAQLRVIRRSRDGTRAEVEVRPHEGRNHQVRRLLAAAGTPVLGDLLYGLPAPGGAPRMALHCARLAWDDDSVVAPLPAGWDALLDPPDPVPLDPPRRSKRESRDRHASDRSTLRVSAATARIVRGGHPWVLRDRDTGALDQRSPGDLVDLVDPRGRWVASAVVDPDRELCARVVSLREGVGLTRDGWEQRATRALNRRSSLLADPTTTAFRLIHGEADGLPGLFIDRWGPTLVATHTTRATRLYREEAYAAVHARLPGLPLYEKDHFVDLRSRENEGSGDALPGRWRSGGWEDELEIVESGLRFAATPFGGLTTGFYPDQRRNRVRLAALPELPGSTIANLFGHTGAFSVALAAAGAEQVITVDLSPRHLDVTRANLVRNGLDPGRHPVTVADAVAWLAESGPTLDGVVIDPPSFAQGRSGRRRFSARTDYRALVTAATRRLRAGGWMLCCRNLRGDRRGKLRAEVEAGIRAAGRTPADVGPAGPADDFPVQRSFSEGTSFHGVFARAL
jgi:23S rRNA (cytosine1962-C5)-methyltransferase